MSAADSDRTWLVASGAALWGLDGLLRVPLTTVLAPATVVLWEHIIAVVLCLPFVPSAVRAFGRVSPVRRLAIVVIGVGASATATALFTEAFALSARHGDTITPLVLQKLQPLFAVALAAWLIGERLRRRFAVFAVPALAGAWLLTFPQPTRIQLHAAEAALFAVGAAALWAAGTVLGRLVGDSVPPRDLTVLRYLWGLPAAFVIVRLTRAALNPGWANVGGLLILALVPGLLALVVYYVGLRKTAASRATFAELAFPVTAAVVGVAFLNTQLSTSQWLGLAVVVGSITALGWRERRPEPTVAVPARANLNRYEPAVAGGPGEHS